MVRGRRVSTEVFASVIRGYLASPKFLSLAPETQRGYRRMLTLAEHPDCLGAVLVEVMRPALVQEFLDGLSDVPGAQTLAQTSLKALERWALIRDQLPRPITLGTEVIGSDGGHEPWTPEQVAFAEENAVAHLSNAISLGANTGQRGSDLSRMRWTDIEMINGRPGINVTQKKTGLQLWVPFTQELIAKMETWERRPGFILTKPDGQPFLRTQLRDAWVRERRRPEMEALRHLHLHGLRATAVVRLQRAGATIRDIVNLVGLSQGMVERYCRLSVQKENAMAAMERLDGQKPASNILKFK